MTIDNKGAENTGAEETKNITNENQGNQNEGHENHEDENDSSNHEESKNTETPEQRYARLKRQTEQLGKKLGIESEKSTKSSKTGELGYGEKAFLFANGVKGADENSLVENFMRETGKSLEDVLESKYFQAELKELRETKASTNAMPTGKNRSSQSSRDSVQFWIDKGELPPTDQIDLRRKVVNEKIARERNKNVFLNL
jgi:hypothetical protein